ncbi:MAG: radical SAM protein [Candidatus Omnitrophota bacterium]
MARKYDCILINPYFVGSSYKFGLLDLASYLRSKGYSVKIINGFLQDIKRYLKLIIKYNKNCVIGFTATTDIYEISNDICDFLKKDLKFQGPVIIGGFHATACKEVVLQEALYDLVVYGEGEETLLEILNLWKADKPLNGIKGTVERRGTDIFINPARPLIENIDDIPVWDLNADDTTNFRTFIRTSSVKNNHIFPLLMSRGCPFDCAFCASKVLWQRRLRFHSLDYIKTLIESVVSHQRVDGFTFHDDEFLCRKDMVIGLCDWLIDSGLSKNIRWEAQARVSTVCKSPDLLKRIKEAGCVLLRFGIESGSERILKSLKNNTIRVEQAYKAIALCKEHGLESFGSFIIGSEDEDLNDICQTIDFIKDSNIDNAEVFTLVPYPGTDLYKRYREKKYLEKGLSYSDFLVEGYRRLPVIRNRSFSNRELLLINTYINKYVTKPLNILKNIPERDHKKDLQEILRGDISLIEKSFIENLTEAISKMKRVLLRPRALYNYLRYCKTKKMLKSRAKVSRI